MKDDLAPLIEQLIEALVNNTKATYLVRRELQNEINELKRRNTILEEQTYN